MKKSIKPENVKRFATNSFADLEELMDRAKRAEQAEINQMIRQLTFTKKLDERAKINKRHSIG